MKTFRETALLLSAALFLTACDKEAVQETGPSGSGQRQESRDDFRAVRFGHDEPGCIHPRDG